MRRSLLVVLALLPLLCRASSSESAPACAGRGTAVVVRTADRKLHLCEKGIAKMQYDVALGSGGVGKRKQGDARTPLGAYPLGNPRPSVEGFGTFVPIGYPTPEQRKRGFTGHSVGIHGPFRSWRWAGRANVASDWTLGCVAVESDTVMNEIARWLRANKAARIHLD